jgi:hypothetical protein
MSTRAPLKSQPSPAPALSQSRTVQSGDVRQLLSLAARGLVAMFDVEKQLFCHRLLRTERGIVREGLSPRYTIMTLLGLRELELAEMDSAFDTQAIYASFIRDTKWIRGIGDLGLLIWLTATFDPDQLEDLLSTFDCETTLDRYSDAREGRTMELAWFLSGLAHAAEARPTLVSTLTDLSVETYHRIEENQGEYGLFGHMSAKKSLRGRLRGRIGSFADQVYPIYGLSKFAKAFDVEDPLGPALECATAICGTQGKSGQWWWHYDAQSGRVSSRYPVYSVHQHGMAPMCLFALEEATGQSFRDPIYKGLRWIYGENELGIDMRDGAPSLIWRCILPENRQAKFWEMALSVLRPTNQNEQVRSLEVLYEERPYEFGWLLFAFARNSLAGPLVRSAE